MDFISSYLEHTSDTEAPMLFHRWSAISIIAATLGRQMYFQLGHFRINPNLYIMIMGEAASRKSTAIKIAKKLLVKSGYSNIAANKTSKEKFLLNMATSSDEALAETLGLDLDLTYSDAEWSIIADEFNVFIGTHNLEFISLLGDLWDYEGKYDSKHKNESFVINNPTLTILGGNTPTSFATAFPAETLGQGFFSRLLLIFSEPTGKRITFPEPPGEQSHLIDMLHKMKLQLKGEVLIKESARAMLDKIYKTNYSLRDTRFSAYLARRFPQLIKLCCVVAASRFSMEITCEDVIYANTMLAYAERRMPKALGEFGKAKNSDAVHKVMQALESTNDVMSLKSLWKVVSQDLNKPMELQEIMVSLTMQDKVISVSGGFLAKLTHFDEALKEFINWDLLTKEEILSL